MASTTLTPEQLAELVSRFNGVKKASEEVADAAYGNSAAFSSLADYLKKPVSFKWNTGLQMVRPISASTSTIQGRSAETIIMDEYANFSMDRDYERRVLEEEAKLAAERRAAEEREGHYKGDPLAGTF